jgi:hypothetical protein
MTGTYAQRRRFDSTWRRLFDESGFITTQVPFGPADTRPMPVELPPTGTISAARLQVIQGRLASQYYDSPAVQEVIVSRIVRELTRSD